MKDGTVGTLAPPARPGAAFETPQSIQVRTAFAELARIQGELMIKADTVARYTRAWEESKKRFGPQGDPSLRRTVNVEYVLFGRLVQSLWRPAARRYSDALASAAAVNAIPPDTALRKLFDLEAYGQSLSGDQGLLSPSLRPILVGAIAQRALLMWRLSPGPRAYTLMWEAKHTADLFGCGDLAPIREIDRIIELAA